MALAEKDKQDIYVSYRLGVNDENVEYTIIGSTESDPSKGLISNESPVGNALLGKKKGDVVAIAAPVGTMNFEIVEISI